MGQPVAKPEGGSLVYLVDGRYVASEEESGHWPFASRLLAGIADASSDAFVRLWSRAVAATFLREYRLGNATYHMQRTRSVLPRDPVMLFYAGALQETLLSGRVRAGQAPSPPKVEMMMGQLRTSPDSEAPTEKDGLQMAERYLRDAVKYGAPLEARLRLARVTGRLGKHAEAIELLAPNDLPEGAPRLAYFRHLFLGTEYRALGKAEEASAAFERAAALYPTAQSPLIALIDSVRRAGNRAAAADVLRRLEALPRDAERRVDPWLDYYRSYADDAGQQLAAVRAWVGARGVR